MSAFINDNITNMSVECICKQISQHLNETSGISMHESEVYQHVTKHMKHRRIDTYVALEDLKAMSQTVKNLTHTIDESTGTAIIDSKLFVIAT